MDLSNTGMTAEQIELVMQAMTPAEKIELERLLEPQKQGWKPYPRQLLAVASKADVLLYGGAAGGGKSDVLLGLAHQHHERSIIFRREYKQLRFLEERSREIYGDFGEYNAGKGQWRIKWGGKDRQIEFGSCANPGDEKAFQGQPHDLKAFDEVEHFLESQFRFLMGWTRTATKGQRTRVVCASNPPTSAEGDWIISYWAPWLDQHYKGVKAEPGELRWFTTIGGKDKEVENGEPFLHNGEMLFPKSRTFIPAKVQDNEAYMASGYVGQLQALPEPLRSKMLYGDFLAGREDHPWQIIPTAWVRAAQERWQNAPDPRHGARSRPMSSIGVDVARGGSDKTVYSPRYGNWFAEQIAVPGSETKDGSSGATPALIMRRDGCPVQVDVIGVGSSVFDVLRSHIGSKAIPMNGSSKTEELDKTGQLGFVNKRAEWWWKLRESLDPESGQEICLPPGQELLADLCAPQWKNTPRGIQVESKEEIIKRLQRSPDCGDSLVYAHAIETQAETARVIQFAHMGR